MGLDYNKRLPQVVNITFALDIEYNIIIYINGIYRREGKKRWHESSQTSFKDAIRTNEFATWEKGVKLFEICTKSHI